MKTFMAKLNIQWKQKHIIWRSKTFFFTNFPKRTDTLRLKCSITIIDWEYSDQNSNSINTHNFVQKNFFGINERKCNAKQYEVRCFCVICMDCLSVMYFFCSVFVSVFLCDILLPIRNACAFFRLNSQCDNRLCSRFFLWTFTYTWNLRAIFHSVNSQRGCGWQFSVVIYCIEMIKCKNFNANKANRFVYVRWRL